jgi:hypothetical protein
MGRKRVLIRIVQVSTLYVLYLFAGKAYADSEGADYLWDHPNSVRVSSEMVAFSGADYKKAKNESIYIMGYFNDGWVFMFNLFHLDSVLFNRWGMYALVTEPDGTSYWKTTAPRAKDITLDEGYLYYSDGVNLVEDSDTRLILKCDFDGFRCDLEFDKLIPPWKPGTGRENYTEEGEYFQYKAVFAPKADLHGTIRIDGLDLSVEGFGYAEKTLFVNPITRFQPYLHALRLYTPYETHPEESWHVGILHAVLNDAYENRELPRLVVARDDRWVFTTRDYTFEPLRTARLAIAPYDYSTAFALHAEKEGYILDGIVEERVFIHFTDVFESVPLWLRNILAVFFKRPVYFRFITDFTGTIREPGGTSHNLKMSGPYEYVVVD